MSLQEATQFVPVFVLTFVRIGGMMIFAPLLGSNRIPRRVRVMLALLLAAGMCGSVKGPVTLPDSTWVLTVGIAGEIAFGIALGMISSFTFIAAQWAGEMMGHQMGMNISEVFDPQFGASGTIIGDLYFMLTIVVFLCIGGHREMIHGVGLSFQSLPLLSLGITHDLLDMLMGLFMSCTTLALRLAAPMLVTMLVVDLALGCIGKAMPQLNVMTMGLAVRAIIGLIVVVVGITLTVNVISGQLADAMNTMQLHWSTP
jgi:flagellar biosynthesis protein FliR